MDEFEIIRRYFAGKITYKNAYVSVGSGDDCAVVQVPEGFELCVSTDTLIEGVHFPLGAAPELIASRAMAANLSDLAAMGAEPYGFTLALTSQGFTEQWLSAFSQRLDELVNTYKVPLLGGNLAKGQLSLTINIMGIVPRGKALLRSGAQALEDVYVSGYLGDAAGGLAMVLGHQVETHAELIERYSNPKPQLNLGQSLRQIATALIDISDGFAADLGHLCKSSGVGARVELAALPISPFLQDLFGNEKARNLAVSGGDDYELCFTAPPGKAAEIQALAGALKVKITRVGETREAPGVDLIDPNGNLFTQAKGYKHF